MKFDALGWSRPIETFRNPGALKYFHSLAFNYKNSGHSRSFEIGLDSSSSPLRFYSLLVYRSNIEKVSTPRADSIVFRLFSRRRHTLYLAVASFDFPCISSRAQRSSASFLRRPSFFFLSIFSGISSGELSSVFPSSQLSLYAKMSGNNFIFLSRIRIFLFRPDTGMGCSMSFKLVALCGKKYQTLSRNIFVRRNVAPEFFPL